MKIGIFTFYCAANYGAVLQAYCLQEVLKDMGHDVYVIDYRPAYLLEPYKMFLYDSNSFSSYLAKCKGFISACLAVPIRWKRNKNFSKFIHSRLNLCHLDLNDESNDFDVFVFGSDQIWSPKIACGFDKVYLGDFPAAKGKKMIAYAASAGSISNFFGEDIDYFLSRLQFFNKVTVREKSLAEYVNQRSLTTSEVVFDPVLLAGPTILHQLLLNAKKVKEQSQKQPYLLLFQIIRNDDLTSYAKAVAKSKGLKLIEIGTMYESLFNNNLKRTVTVEQLLSYFINATYIITTSFHGTVLSILFNKQFNTISLNKSTDERALSLLKQLHLSDRMLHINEKPSSSLIDYNTIHHLYIQDKIESYNLLNNSLLCH